MNETEKSLRLPHRRDTWELCQGRGLDIGSGPNPLVLPGREIHTFDQMPGATFTGDAQYLGCIPNESYGFVHASHCLEHVHDVQITLHNWARVLKPGCPLIITVPSWTFYEHGRPLPSIHNDDHKHCFDVLPMPDGFQYWSIVRMTRTAESLGLRLVNCWLELDRFDFAAHASRFFVDQTLADATAQVCFVFKKRPCST